MEDFDNGSNDEVVSNEVEQHEASEPVSRRDALAAAFEAATKEEEPAANVSEQKAPSESGSTDHVAAQGSNDDQATEAPQEQTAAVKAPSSFSPQMREEFNSLSPAMQSQITKREADWDNFLRKSNDERQFVRSVMETMAPYQEHLQASNLHPVSVMKDLMSQVYTMRVGSPEQKAEVVKNIIQGYKVDINTLARMIEGSGYTQENAQANDPVMQKIQALEQQLHQRTALEQQQQQQQAQAREQQVISEVQKFAADPKNEFFGDVHPIMQSLLANGQANTLQDAYERAIWAHPDVRQLLQQRQQSEVQKKQADAQRLNASQSIKGGGPRGSAPVGKKQLSRREAIEAALAAQQGKDKI